MGPGLVNLKLELYRTLSLNCFPKTLETPIKRSIEIWTTKWPRETGAIHVQQFHNSYKIRAYPTIKCDSASSEFGRRFALCLAFVV
jgi:hypothetical protein